MTTIELLEQVENVAPLEWRARLVRLCDDWFWLQDRAFHTERTTDKDALAVALLRATECVWSVSNGHYIGEEDYWVQMGPINGVADNLLDAVLRAVAAWCEGKNNQ